MSRCCVIRLSRLVFLMSEPIWALKCRGIGEPATSANMCDMVTRKLSSRFVAKEVPWGATYGPVPNLGGPSYSKSLADGRVTLLRMIDEAPGRVVLLGFSAGADLASLVAAEIGAGKHPRLSLSGVGLIADPRNPRSSTDPNARWGIAGSRPIFSRDFSVWRANDPGDPIPLCDANSPLRWLADTTAGLSLTGGWIASTRARLLAREMQQVIVNVRDPRGVHAQFARARYQLDGYLKRGDHVGYARRIEPGTRGTYTDNLAAKIEAGVR